MSEHLHFLRSMGVSPMPRCFGMGETPMLRKTITAQDDSFFCKGARGGAR
jgi:hypothetical protein